VEYLKCDADWCDYEGNEPDYGAHLIGKPCPKCGADLLTQGDFDQGEPMRTMMQMLVKAGLVFEPDADTSHMKAPALLKVKSHKGKIIIETKTAIAGGN